MVQSVWLKTFWPISKELDFPKYGLCAENSINFHYKINSEKINDQFFQLLKKTIFDHFLPIMAAKKISQISGPTTHKSIWELRLCQNLEKTDDPIPR